MFSAGLELRIRRMCQARCADGCGEWWVVLVVVVRWYRALALMRVII